MREIKFKAFHDGEMRYNASKIGNALYWDNGRYFDLLAFKQNTPAVMLQFIGLHDLHGIPVYESDVVRKEMCAPDDMAYGYYGDDGIVEYNTNAMRYIIHRIDDNTGVFWDMSVCEVIGNVYENSELCWG